MKKLLAALKGEIFSPPPFWLMRQAGRYLPEYWEVRKTAGSFMNLCLTPELACEVTLQPLKRFDFDGAILFSDILIIPHALGQEVRFEENYGPKLAPFDLRRIEARGFSLDESLVQRVYAAVSLIQSSLPPAATFIGFAGTPWTLATYMIEEGKSKDFKRTLSYLQKEPDQFKKLIKGLTQAIITFLDQQIRYGVEVIQLFDSWAGLVPPAFQLGYLLEPLKEIYASLKSSHPAVPIIYFGRHVSALTPRFVEECPELVVSLDEGVSPLWANQHLPSWVPIQGNLSPATLVEGGARLKEEVATLKSTFAGRPYIFNLGHGILPQTPISHVEELVSYVKAA